MSNLEAQIGSRSAGIASRIGTSVRTMREDRGWSAAELARRAGVTEAAVARLEASWPMPRLPVVERVCAALDADIELRITPRAGGRAPSGARVPEARLAEPETRLSDR